MEQYAAICGLTISETIRMAVMEKIEDELDVEICRKPLESYGKDSQTYALDEVKNESNLL